MSVTLKTLVATSLIVTLAVSSPAQAQNIVVNASGERTMFVDYSDLNIESSKGQRTLSARLDRAASKVCGRDNSKISVGEETQIRACEKGTKETALASLDGRGRVQVAAVTITGK